MLYYIYCPSAVLLVNRPGKGLIMYTGMNMEGKNYHKTICCSLKLEVSHALLVHQSVNADRVALCREKRDMHSFGIRPKSKKARFIDGCSISSNIAK